MSEFWNNVSRYPRFFISSVFGLVLVILTPFRNLLKIKKFRIIAPVILVLFFGILYGVLAGMTNI